MAALHCDRTHVPDLSAGDQQGERLAPAPTGNLASDELPHLIEVAKHDPEVRKELVAQFQNGDARRALLDYVFEKIAKIMGKDPALCAAIVDGLSLGLERPGDEFQDSLLAEGMAFAHLHSTLALGRIYEVQADPLKDSRDHAYACRNSANAVLSATRMSRELGNARLRPDKSDLLKRQAEETSARTQKLQEQLRQLKEGKPVEEKPKPSARDAYKTPEFVPPPYNNPQLYGFETFEEYVADLEEPERVKLLAELAYDDRTRGNWGDDSNRFDHRFPSLFPNAEAKDTIPTSENPESQIEPLESPETISEKHVKPISREPKSVPRETRIEDMERGASAPHPGPRSFRSDAHPPAPNQRDKRFVAEMFKELNPPEPRRARTRRAWT